MAEYNSLAALRAALTDDDADRRSQAYAAVLGEDVEPSSVLQEEPPSETVEQLEQAGVIPGPDEERTPPGWRNDVVKLLEKIEDNTRGGGA